MEDFQLVADCLKEYMEGFQKRNPNFYVFNAVLHMTKQLRICTLITFPLVTTSVDRTRKMALSMP